MTAKIARISPVSVNIADIFLLIFCRAFSAKKGLILQKSLIFTPELTAGRATFVTFIIRGGFLSLNSQPDIVGRLWTDS